MVRIDLTKYPFVFAYDAFLTEPVFFADFIVVSVEKELVKDVVAVEKEIVKDAVKFEQEIVKDVVNVEKEIVKDVVSGAQL